MITHGSVTLRNNINTVMEKRERVCWQYMQIAGSKYAIIKNILNLLYLKETLKNNDIHLQFHCPQVHKGQY